MRRFQHIAWSLFEVMHLPLLMVRWRPSTPAVLVKMRAFHDPMGLYRYLERHGAWSRCEKTTKWRDPIPSMNYSQKTKSSLISCFCSRAYGESIFQMSSLLSTPHTKCII